MLIYVIFIILSTEAALGLREPKASLRITREEVCPGMDFTFPKAPSRFCSLVFSKDGNLREVANLKTGTSEPGYRIRDHVVILSEVMERHTGEYYWEMSNIKWKLENIMLTLKDCSRYMDLTYGENFRLILPDNAASLDFIPKDLGFNSEGQVIWNRTDDPKKTLVRGVLDNNQWIAERMTQADQGSYTLRKENGVQTFRTVITVNSEEKYVHVNDAKRKGSLDIHVNIPVHEVEVIYWKSTGGSHVIFQEGMLSEDGHNLFQERILLHRKYQLSILTLRNVQPSDAGQYEIRDGAGNVAMSLTLEKDPDFDPRTLAAPLGITAGVLAGLLCCCWCCCKVCCGDDKDDNKAENEGADESPDIDQTGYIHPPPTGDSTELQATVDYPANPWERSPPAYIPDRVPSPSNSAVPSDPTEPHLPFGVSKPTIEESPAESFIPDRVPFPYNSTLPSEASQAISEVGAGGNGGYRFVPSVPRAPTPPPIYEPGPQYQARAWGSGMDDFLASSPLTSDTTVVDSSTYNSDKLNF